MHPGGRRGQAASTVAPWGSPRRRPSPPSRRLTGDIHASSVSAAYETAFFVREAILDRLRWAGDATRDYGSLPATYTADLPGRAAPIAPVPVRGARSRVFGLWGQGFGSFGRHAVTAMR